jgi:catechol 2,3-dioxygenase-like lactoylglutathione lyase family enzyme
VSTPLIRKVDALMVRVPDLEQGLAFYSDHLGHPLLWRNEDSCGLAMSGSDTELVISTRLGPETDLKVDSADEAAGRFVAGGGQIIAGPDDIEIGRVAVVADPFGNRLVLLDTTKGTLIVDEGGKVTGVRNGGDSQPAGR